MLTSNGFPNKSIEHSATLDYARFLAAVGIIIFHVGAAGARIGYAALPFFCMLLVFLAFPAATRRNFRTYAATRMTRLLRPWAIWSLVYAGLKLAEAGITGVPLETEFAPWMLLAGPAIHLWFLPFACVACIAIWPLARFSSMLPEFGRTICGLILAVLAAVIAGWNHTLVTAQPFAQWLYVLPSVILGAAFGFLGETARAALKTMFAVSIMACLLLIIGRSGGSAEQLIMAAVAFILCLVIRLPDHPAARRMAALSLTLYLAHPMVISILLRVTSIPEASPAMAMAAVTGTILLALGLQTIQKILASG